MPQSRIYKVVSSSLVTLLSPLLALRLSTSSLSPIPLLSLLSSPSFKHEVFRHLRVLLWSHCPCPLRHDSSWFSRWILYLRAQQHRAPRDDLSWNDTAQHGQGNRTVSSRAFFQTRSHELHGEVSREAIASQLHRLHGTRLLACRQRNGQWMRGRPLVVWLTCVE